MDIARIDKRISQWDDKAAKLKIQLQEVQQDMDKCKQEKQRLLQFKSKHEQEGRSISDQYAAEQAQSKVPGKNKSRTRDNRDPSELDTQDLFSKLCESKLSAEARARIHSVLQQVWMEDETKAKEQQEHNARQQQESNSNAFQRSTMQVEPSQDRTNAQGGSEQVISMGAASGGSDLSTTSTREASAKEKRAREDNSSSKSRSPHHDTSNGGKRREHSPGQTVCATAAAARKEAQQK